MSFHNKERKRKVRKAKIEVAIGCGKIFEIIKNEKMETEGVG